MGGHSRECGRGRVFTPRHKHVHTHTAWHRGGEAEGEAGSELDSEGRETRTRQAASGLDKVQFKHQTLPNPPPHPFKSRRLECPHSQIGLKSLLPSSLPPWSLGPIPLTARTKLGESSLQRLMSSSKSTLSPPKLVSYRKHALQRPGKSYRMYKPLRTLIK